MSDWGGATDDAADVIHDAFATVTLTYTPSAGPAVPGIAAIPMDWRGDDPLGDGRSVRQRGYEIRKAAVTGKPQNGAAITIGSAQFRVIEVEDRAEAGAWALWVESQ